MLPFLLPNSIFCTRAATATATSRASSSLALLTTKSRIANQTKFHANSRLFANDATEEHEADHEDESFADVEGDLGPQNQGEHVRWLMTQGAEFRRPKPDGPNWLGGNVPFPLNPSFKPPPPISDKIRTHIFNLFIKGEKNESELSQTFGYSVSRIKAILRLKKLEQLWSKGRVCQYRFQMEMEGHLGVSTSNDPRVLKDRQMANSIDVDVDIFAIGQSNRFQRVFYEVVPEGQQPPLAQYMDLEEAIIEDAKTKADERRQAAKVSKAKSIVVAPVSLRRPDGKPFRSATKYKWFYPSKAGRPPYTFVDVGHRYLRGSDLAKREEKQKKLKQKGRRDHEQDQLVMAEKAQKMRREISYRETLARSDVVKMKRREQTQRELALRRARAKDAMVNL